MCIFKLCHDVDEGLRYYFSCITFPEQLQKELIFGKMSFYF